MPTDAELVEMLEARVGRAQPNGLLEDARLLALAAGRGRMDRWNLRWPLAAAVLATAVTVTVTLSAVRLAPSRDAPSPIGSANSPTQTLSRSTEPSPAASPSPSAIVTCLRLTDDFCQRAVELARSKAPKAFANQSAILVANSCPPGAFCQFGTYAFVVATNPGWSSRSELRIFLVNGLQTPEKVVPMPTSEHIPQRIVDLLPRPAVPSPDGKVAWTVAQLVARPISPRPVELIVTGWLSATPVLECRAAPAPAGALEFGCSERDWLTQDRFQPYVGRATRDPKGGIRLPNRSYEQFGGRPSTGYSARAPVFGTWIVRVSTGSTCDFLPPSTGAVCAGGPVRLVQILERLS
jgi:hypothetical protein